MQGIKKKKIKKGCTKDAWVHQFNTAEVAEKCVIWGISTISFNKSMQWMNKTWDILGCNE